MPHQAHRQTPKKLAPDRFDSFFTCPLGRTSAPLTQEEHTCSTAQIHATTPGDQPAAPRRRVAWCMMSSTALAVSVESGRALASAKKPSGTPPSSPEGSSTPFVKEASSLWCPIKSSADEVRGPHESDLAGRELEMINAKDSVSAILTGDNREPSPSEVSLAGSTDTAEGGLPSAVGKPVPIGGERWPVSLADGGAVHTVPLVAAPLKPGLVNATQPRPTAAPAVTGASAGASAVAMLPDVGAVESMAGATAPTMVAMQQMSRPVVETHETSGAISAIVSRSSPSSLDGSPASTDHHSCQQEQPPPSQPSPAPPPQAEEPPPPPDEPGPSPPAPPVPSTSSCGSSTGSDGESAVHHPVAPPATAARRRRCGGGVGGGAPPPAKRPRGKRLRNELADSSGSPRSGALRSRPTRRPPSRARSVSRCCKGTRRSAV